MLQTHVLNYEGFRRPFCILYPSKLTNLLGGHYLYGTRYNELLLHYVANGAYDIYEDLHAKWTYTPLF